jgi:hypothetical protein
MVSAISVLPPVHSEEHTSFIAHAPLCTPGACATAKERNES